VLLVDKAYSHPGTRAALRARGIRATIPERDDQLARRRARGPGRSYAFNAELYKNRNVVERCFSRSSNGEESPPATTRPPATIAVASCSSASS
jgi:transposase